MRRARTLTACPGLAAAGRFRVQRTVARIGARIDAPPRRRAVRKRVAAREKALARGDGAGYVAAPFGWPEAMPKTNRSVVGNKSLSIGRRSNRPSARRDAQGIVRSTDRLWSPVDAWFRSSGPTAISHALSVNRWLSNIRAYSLPL
jgi:hypothetical protein